MEPPHKGHFETASFVLCKKAVLLIWEIQNVLELQGENILGPQAVFFAESVLIHISEYYVRDSTVCTHILKHTQLNIVKCIQWNLR